MSYTDNIGLELKEWTESIIKSNPAVFGRRTGNNAIIREYLKKVHEGTLVEDLTLEAIKASVKVSRWRNKFLEGNPQYDLRGRK